MNTRETYVSLEVAKLLKKAGFDWYCLLRYWADTGKTEWFGNSMIVNPYGDDTIPCPTLSVAQKWLREVKNIHIVTNFKYDKDIAYDSTVYELIIDDNPVFFMPGLMEKPLHFCPNNVYFRGHSLEYKNPDDALSDAILLALKYLTLEKSEYSEYYTNYLKGK